MRRFFLPPLVVVLAAASLLRVAATGARADRGPLSWECRQAYLALRCTLASPQRWAGSIPAHSPQSPVLAAEVRAVDGRRPDFSEERIFYV